MICREIMQATVRTCQSTDTAARCADIMKTYDLGFLPVVDADGKLLGAVTDRDIVLGVLAAKRTLQAHVSYIMREDVATCRCDDPLRFAEDELVRTGTSHVVVIDDHGRVVGVISLSDIGRVEDPARAGQVLGAIVRGRPPCEVE